MHNIFKLLTGGLAVAFFAFGCQSELNSPERNNLLKDEMSYETLDSDLEMMNRGGMPLDDAAGIFSIGWNEMFKSIENGSQVRGMAFAVAFGERQTDLRHFRKFGLDMGNIFINYSGNQIEMHKRFHDRRGVAYSLFNKPFGNSLNLLEFIPNTEYEFEVTGSEYFEPITINLTSPNALMDITSHSSGDEINPAENLTINWDGGSSEGKVAVRLMPHMKYNKGPKGGHRGPGKHHPRLDRIIFEILETNTGTYTFTAEVLQRVLYEIDAEVLMVEVSQMDFGEVEHNNGMIRTAMRNGNSVKLIIK
jgi:hypothetical protein